MSQGTGTRVKAESSKKKVVALAVALVVLVVAVVAITLAVRGGDDDASTASGPGGTQLDQYPVPDVDKLDKVGSKAKQTEITSCSALDEGGWQAMGTVENTGDKPRDYEITVFFMNDEKAVNFAATKVTAPADTKVPWVVEKVFGTDYDLTCKLVAVS